MQEYAKEVGSSLQLAQDADGSKEHEEWRKIPNYPDYYEVSNLGRIRRTFYYKKGTVVKILVPYIPDNGYARIKIQYPHRKNTILKPIHRMVALAFLPNPDNLPCINHKDECKYNNRVDNLEWCTYKYNCNYGTGIQRCSESRKKSAKHKEARKIAGEKLKEKYNTQEYKTLFSERRKSREARLRELGLEKRGPRPPEFCAKMKAEMQRRFSNEEYRAKMKICWQGAITQRKAVIDLDTGICYDYAIPAAEALGITPRQVKGICLKNCKSEGMQYRYLGFRLAYKETVDKVGEIA